MKHTTQYILILLLCLFTLTTPSNTLAEKPIGETILDGKKCNYLREGKYMPFSDVNTQFPLFGGIIKDGCIDVKNEVGNMFIAGFQVFLGLVSLYAVINISIAGIQWMIQEKDTDKKRGAKKRLTDSIVGLILALSGWVILSSVNMRLTEVGFNLNNALTKMIQAGAGSVENIAPVEIEDTEGGAGQSGGTVPQTYTADGAEAQRMDTAARGLLGKNTCNVKGTEGGNLACAYVVNDIVNQALGKPITGTSDATDTFGRSTAEMKTDLDKSTRFYLVGSDTNQLAPGDIIISPTAGNNTGHVGVYTSTGKIISNSSSRTEVDDHFTPTSWTNHYNGTKKLTTYVYRARAQ